MILNKLENTLNSLKISANHISVILQSSAKQLTDSAVR